MQGKEAKHTQAVSIFLHKHSETQMEHKGSGEFRLKRPDWRERQDYYWQQCLGHADTQQK